jgi:hypothetical protein
MLLAGCGQRASDADTADVTQATPVETAAPVAEPVAPAPVAVVELPKVAASVPAADAAPLVEAASAQRLIDSDARVRRVRQGDGWAWMRNDHVIRTASLDGRRVSYYREGDDKPYLVQDGDRTFAYSTTGQVRRQYDRQGRPQAPSAEAQRQGRDLAQTAERDHQRAEEAARTSDRRDQDDQRDRAGTSGTRGSDAGRNDGRTSATSSRSPQTSSGTPSQTFTRSGRSATDDQASTRRDRTGYTRQDGGQTTSSTQP